MQIKNVLSSAAFATVFIAAGFAQTAMAAEDAGNDAHKGTAKVKLQYVHAVQQNGSPAPAHDAACRHQLSSPNSKFVGMPVSTSYDIDTKTLMMSAESMFPSPHSMQPLEFTVNLNALGMKGVYAFGAFKPTEVSEVYAVLFSISEKFERPSSTFVVYGPKGGDYNCVISSAKDAAKHPEAGRFKEE